MRKTVPFGPQIDLTLLRQTLDCCPQTERRRGPSVVWREGKEAPMTRQWLAHLLNLGHNHQTWGSSCKDLPYSDCFGWDTRYCSREGNCSHTWGGPCLCRCPAPDKTIATLWCWSKYTISSSDWISFVVRLDHFLSWSTKKDPLYTTVTIDVLL